MELYLIVLEYLNSQKRKRVKTIDIEKNITNKLGSENYWDKYGGYSSFVDAVNSLVEKGIIRPLKAWGQNGMEPPLYNGYQIILKSNKLDDNLINKLSINYHPRIKVSYYFNHKSEYQKDEYYLLALDRFLKENPHYDKLSPITLNERSFQIFQDEKWLLSKHGSAFLNRVGLTLEDLCCFPTYEPFFYFKNNVNNTINSSSSINAIIIENKDTFFSLKTLFQKGIYSWSNAPFSLLIYGEGRKILKSFTFFWELEEYRDYNTNFFYFGDLDPEGISIWFELQNKVKLEIKPFAFFYSTLVNNYINKAMPIRKKQRILKEAIDSFLRYFPSSKKDEIHKIVNNNLYLPQEGLNLQILKELSDQNS